MTRSGTPHALSAQRGESVGSSEPRAGGSSSPNWRLDTETHACIKEALDRKGPAALEAPGIRMGSISSVLDRAIGSSPRRQPAPNASNSLWTFNTPV